MTQFYCWGYTKLPSQRLSPVMAYLIGGCLAAIGVASGLALIAPGASEDESSYFGGWEWLDVVCCTTFFPCLSPPPRPTITDALETIHSRYTSLGTLNYSSLSSNTTHKFVSTTLISLLVGGQSINAFWTSLVQFFPSASYSLMPRSLRGGSAMLSEIQ